MADKPTPVSSKYE